MADDVLRKFFILHCTLFAWPVMFMFENAHAQPKYMGMTAHVHVYFCVAYSFMMDKLSGSRMSQANAQFFADADEKDWLDEHKDKVHRAHNKEGEWYIPLTSDGVAAIPGPWPTDVDLSDKRDIMRQVITSRYRMFSFSLFLSTRAMTPYQQAKHVRTRLSRRRGRQFP